MTKTVLCSICVCMMALGLIIPSQSSAAVDPSTAVGVWLFEGDVTDSSGNGNDGELVNGATFSPDGKFNKQALSLDGEDDYVLVKTSGSLDGTADAYTGVAWVKFKNKGAPHGVCCADDHVVIAFTAQWHNLLNVFGPGRGANQGKVEVGSGELSPSWLSGPTAVNDDQWHHLAFSYDGAVKKIYIDGKVDIEQATTGSFGVEGVELMLGGTPTERWAMGLIDDIGIFNVSLEEADIQALMNDGLAKSIGIVAVEPQDKLATMWADIKSAR
jgi:hypothetical protein